LTGHYLAAAIGTPDCGKGSGLMWHAAKKSGAGENDSRCRNHHSQSRTTAGRSRGIISRPIGAASRTTEFCARTMMFSRPREVMAMSDNRVCFWEINGTEGGKLAAFYTGVFGWQADNEPGSDYFHLHSGGNEQGGIAGGVFTGKGKLPHHLTIYVDVDDADAYFDRALELGATPAQAPFNVEGVGRLGFFRDPDGHIIGLIQRS